MNLNQQWIYYNEENSVIYWIFIDDKNDNCSANCSGNDKIK